MCLDPICVVVCVCVCAQRNAVVVMVIVGGYKFYKSWQYRVMWLWCWIGLEDWKVYRRLHSRCNWSVHTRTTRIYTCTPQVKNQEYGIKLHVVYTQFLFIIIIYNSNRLYIILTKTTCLVAIVAPSTSTFWVHTVCTFYTAKI